MTVMAETLRPRTLASDTMRATVFHGPDDIRVDEVPRPHAGVGEAVDPRHDDHHLRHGHPHPQGRVPGPSRA